MGINAPKSAGTSSLRTGLRIISTVLERELSGRAGFNVARLADELGIDRSKASRMTQELCDRGFLERNDDATLRVSTGYFALPESLGHGLLSQSRPLLRRIAVSFGANARISVLDGVVVRTLRTESATELRPTPANLVSPCWCTGSGRALLLDHGVDAVAALLEGYELIGVGGPNAAHSAEELMALNERDKAGGTVAARDEFEHGMTEFAAPIRDKNSRIVAAVAVLGRGQDLAPQEDAIRDALAEAARTLAGSLSGSAA